jgi:16S rRNA (cytosine967-C5)-methyltransferase
LATGSDSLTLAEKDIAMLVQTFFYNTYLDTKKDPYFTDFKPLKSSISEDTSSPVYMSCPDWLWQKGLNELPDTWTQEYTAMHTQAQVFLRVNQHKISLEDLKHKLDQKGIETQEIVNVPSALTLNKRSNVFGLEEFKEGFFEVQDAGSQLIAPFLEVEPGMRVIDACAGAGGKALHLSNLMENKGSIIAMDVEEHKLFELKKRAKRNGAHNIEIRLIEPKTIKRLAASADRLLLDVPCSGIGVLKRNPDAKWKLKPDFYDKVALLQSEILENYSIMLKPGGLLVYATCSIFPSENQHIVQKFLEKNKEFELQSSQTLYPSELGFDGYYMALIKKHKS